MIISPINISPLSPKRSGVGATPLIPTMKHEWYFNNVQNASANIITIPDTGTVGGMDLSNPALANKPTASTINGLVSYKGDGVDDYIYKATEDFGMSYANWMCHVVFKYDISINNEFLTAFNETNTNNEGWTLRYSSSGLRFQQLGFNSSGTVANRQSNVQVLVNGNDYVVTFVYTGTNVTFYFGTTQIGSIATDNPFMLPSNVNNLAMFALIKPSSTTGNSYSTSNIGYVGLDEYNLTNLTNNVNTLKTLYGIT